MRVISGAVKGRHLKWPKNIRPTRDFVKEALFNILGDIIGKNIYDICAGSGSLGVEALSRGAAKVTFIESEKEQCKCIEKNLLGFDRDQYNILQKKFETITIPLTTDIVFFDPPYANQELYHVIFQLAHQVPLLVIESNKPIDHEGYKLEDQRRYGTTYLSFFRPIVFFHNAKNH